MADIEDGAEFGSHFLDSLLEVEMREEDGEVDISKNEDPLAENAGALPPIPMFDLQNQTLTYKSPVVGSGFQNPLVTSVVPNILPMVSSVPIVNSKSFVTLHSKNVPSMSTVVTTNVNPNTTVPRPNIKHNITVVKNSSASQQMNATRFLRQVFKPEFIKNVFTKKDPPSNVSDTGTEEMNFYKTCFKDVSNVQYCRIHCTICDKHLGCSTSAEKKLMVHKMLRVLTCKPCSEFYGDGNFPCDTGDNCEIYCRWCGQGGALVCCSFCPRVFCKKCVRRNFGSSFLRSIQRALEWACFCCAQKPLWPHRAICRALIEYIKRKKTENPKLATKDTTTCCISLLNKKKIKPLDKNKIFVSGGPIKISPVPKIAVPPLELKNKIIVPIKGVTGNEQSLLKSNVKMRMNDQNRDCLGGIKILGKPPAPVLSTGPLPATLPIAPAFYSNVSFADTKKNFLSLGGPHLIQRPVLHGETVITPPGARKVILSKPQLDPTPSESPSVKVSFTTQTTNVDMTKIPTAKIPHDVQDLVLRITFPDRKVQYVQLKTEGSGCKGLNHYSIPQFNRDAKFLFLEEQLQDSFELSKIIHDKLRLLREKVNNPDKVEETNVPASAVAKLHFLYEKSTELFQDLNKNLSDKFENWKAANVGNVTENEKLTSLKVAGAEVTDSKRTASMFMEKCKRVLASDDSDVEILDPPKSSLKTETTGSGPKKLTGNVSVNGRSTAGNVTASVSQPSKMARSSVAGTRKKKPQKRKTKRVKEVPLGARQP